MSLISLILTILTWGVVALAVVMMVINLLIARRRSWITAIIRLALTIIALIAAILITKPLANRLTDMTYERILPILGDLIKDLDIVQLMSDIPSGEEGLKVLSASMVAPVLFFLLFIVIRLLLAIIGSIVAACVPPLKARTKRGISMPLGALNGLFITLILLIPLCGSMVVLGHMMNTIATTADACDSPAIDEFVSGLGYDTQELAAMGQTIEKNPVVLVVHSSIGRPIFHSLTTGTTEAEKTHGRAMKLNLETEIGGLVKTFIHSMDAVYALGNEDFTEEDKNRLYLMEESLLESEWRTAVMTDLLTSAATSWRKGEAYLGIERPVLNASMDPTINCLLDILAHESDLTLEEDFHDILDVVGDFLLCDLLAETTDPQALIKTISERDLLNTTMNKLNANPRLAPIALELKALSVRLLSDMLGLEQLKNGEHAELMNTVAGELNNVLELSEEERHAAISDALGTAFNDYGFEVPEDVAIEMSDQMIAELGADGEISGDELTDYLVNHVDDASGLIPDEIPDEIPGDIPDEIPDISFD